MSRYKLEITLESPCLIGSGEGFGAIIDSDIIFDEIGIPYIPAKRIKGCIKESAIEVCEMFEQSGIDILGDLKNNREYGENSYKIISDIFGKQGSDKPSPVYFSNLAIEGYDSAVKWFRYLTKKYNSVFNREAIINQFTEIRQQTSIEDGVAKDHSLRTIRVAKKGLVFKGDVKFEEDKQIWLSLLFFACKNFRYMGSKRNRGFGKIKCVIGDDSIESEKLREMEAVCSK